MNSFNFALYIVHYSFLFFAFLLLAYISTIFFPELRHNSLSLLKKKFTADFDFLKWFSFFSISNKQTLTWTSKLLNFSILTKHQKKRSRTSTTKVFIFIHFPFFQATNFKNCYIKLFFSSYRINSSFFSFSFFYRVRILARSLNKKKYDFISGWVFFSKNWERERVSKQEKMEESEKKWQQQQQN